MSDNTQHPVPSPNGTSTRFKPGNRFGKGNPLGGKIEKLRAAIVQATTREDFQAIARKLVAMAKTGDVAAAREVFDRVLGKPNRTVTLDADPIFRTPADRAAEAASMTERLRMLLDPSGN